MLNRKYGYSAVVVFILLAGLISQAWAVGADDALAAGKKDIVTIEKKIRAPLRVNNADEPGQASSQRPMSIIADGTRYNIIPPTEVFGPDDKQISMDTLPVPCQAQIVYQPLRRSSSNVLRIKLLRLLRGASIRWSKMEAD